MGMGMDIYNIVLPLLLALGLNMMKPAFSLALDYIFSGRSTKGQGGCIRTLQYLSIISFLICIGLKSESKYCSSLLATATTLIIL